MPGNAQTRKSIASKFLHEREQVTPELVPRRTNFAGTSAMLLAFAISKVCTIPGGMGSSTA